MRAFAKEISYGTADFWEVAKLSLSFIVVLFSASLMGLCDRLILAHYSIEGLETGVMALWLGQLFQMPLIRAASMTQVFVGQYQGAGQMEKIGPCVWQMIWFSLLTMGLTGPLGGSLGALFFQHTSLVDGGRCFNCLMAVNFLFPLGTVLAAFYLGRGLTRRVVYTSLASHALHIALDFPLVFGIEGFIPALGALGSVLSSIVAQLFFCAGLLLDFLQAKNRAVYHTHRFSLQWASFVKYVKIGMPRSIAKLIQLGAWIAMSKIMVGKGGDYAVVLAFGGSLHMFFTCLNEGLSQALTTIGSYLIGSRQLRIWKVVRSGSLFLGVMALLLAIPLLFFPKSLAFGFFGRGISMELQAVLCASCLWIWLLFLMEGLNLIGFALLSAYGDTVFQMWFATSAWATCFLPAYFLIHRGDAPADQFWLVAAIACLIAAAVYFARLCQSRWKVESPLT